MNERELLDSVVANFPFASPGCVALGAFHDFMLNHFMPRYTVLTVNAVLGPFVTEIEPPVTVAEQVEDVPQRNTYAVTEQQYSDPDLPEYRTAKQGSLHQEPFPLGDA